MNEITFDCYGECNYKGFRIVHARELLENSPWAIMQIKHGLRADYYNDYYYVIKGNWASKRVNDLKFVIDYIDKYNAERGE